MTGTVHGPEPLDPDVPRLNDGYDDDLIVALGVNMINGFAMRRLDRNDADVMLGFWGIYGRLTKGQIRAVLARFPDYADYNTWRQP